ncbi:MAG TPA: alpha/beta hydrolase [Steroidobacteraceae bacterium]
MGTWQGGDGPNLRQVIKITTGPGGKLHGEAFYLGPEGPPRNGNPISTVEVQGPHVHLIVDDSLTTIDADLSADGKSLTGTSVTGGVRAGQPRPIRFDRVTEKTAWPIDPSPHRVRFVEVEKGVRLEVLDWGGKGPPLVFVPGDGNTGHAFDDFAPLFTAKHHVYAITRRGSGMSSKPEPTPENYSAERLGEDVLAVIDALKLDHPVLAGHSRGGEELSFFGARHPERVSGLIYLEAGYDYAFHDPRMESKVRDLGAKQGFTPPPGVHVMTMDSLSKSQSLQDKVSFAIVSGGQKYTAINGPVLAIFGDHRDFPPLAAQVDAFEAGVPQAKVVRIANGQHYIFRSNLAEVEREMNAFMDGLPKAK